MISEKFGQQPFRYLLWTILAVVCIWSVVTSVRSAWRSEKNPGRTSDFAAFYGAGTLALQGDSIYDVKKTAVTYRPFIYPPTFAVFPMMPLALLPFNTALIVFTILNHTALLLACWLVRDAMWGNWDIHLPETFARSTWTQLWRHPDTGLMLAVLICSRGLQSNMRHGNANTFVLLALALGCWWAVKSLKASSQYHQAFLSGVAVALATAIKVTPGLFGLYLLWTRRWLGLFGGAVGLVFFLLLMPALPLGFSNTVARLKEFALHASSAVAGEGSEADVVDWQGAAQKQIEAGICIRGSLMSVLTNKPLVTSYKGKNIESRISLVDLPENTARNLLRCVELLVLGLTVALTARQISRCDPGGLALSWGLVAETMLLISPVTRKAHFCVLIISCGAMFALMQQSRITGLAKKFCLVAMFVLCLRGVVFSDEIIGQVRSDVLDYGGFGLLLLALIYAANAWALWKLEPVDGQRILA